VPLAPSGFPLTVTPQERKRDPTFVKPKLLAFSQSPVVRSLGIGGVGMSFPEARRPSCTQHIQRAYNPRAARLPSSAGMTDHNKHPE
jgi:hypothetical protein